MTETILPATSLSNLKVATAFKKFATDRNGSQFHSPKNLGMALTGEMCELSEVF